MIGEENASYIHIEKTAPSPGGHVFSLITTIFKLIRHINKTNVLTKFHDDRQKNVTIRVFTSFFNGLKPFFNSTVIFRKKNVLTKCHEDWAKNVHMFSLYTYRENCPPPPGGHVFPPIMTIFELFQDIYKIDI
ncbi:hypothetical protein DPMN_058802 [Dreissena polymorpha]|uniref:Uncharacterized protein n=1 Tax=Dreissena polymorpha TaxID=45954 RepID=A0A9D4C2R3_DREPO|nr:hypothetical protein DPMN_058802 [Dreissena polymorpha]